MEGEGDEIKSRQASKRDRTLTFFLKYTIQKIYIYRKVTSSSPSRIEANAGFFRMKGIFDPYVL